MIEVTEKAAAEVQRILTEQELPEQTALRVGVKGGGCSGFSYTLGFDDQINEIFLKRYKMSKEELVAMAGTHWRHWSVIASLSC